VATAVQEALKEKQSHLLSQAFVRSLSSTCLCPADGMPGATVLLCFISGQQMGFKTPNLKVPNKVQTHSPPPPPPHRTSISKSLALTCLKL